VKVKDFIVYFYFFLAFLQPKKPDISRLQPRGGHHSAECGMANWNGWADVFIGFYLRKFVQTQALQKG
jgi:hypothetical protein